MSVTFSERELKQWCLDNKGDPIACALGKNLDLRRSTKHRTRAASEVVNYIDKCPSTINVQDKPWNREAILYHDRLADIVLNDEIGVTCACAVTSTERRSIECPPEKLIIQHRIGSDSKYGEVYLASLSVRDVSMDIAIKVCPVISQRSLVENQREIYISMLCSQSGSPYFLKMLWQIHCKNTVLDPSSRFYQPTLVFAKCVTLQHCIREAAMRDSVKPVIQRLMMKKLSELNDCEENASVDRVYNDIASRLPADLKQYYIENGRAQISHVMFMELASTDAITYFKDSARSKSDVAYIVLEAFRAINTLHDLGINHRDLHLGNVLLILKEPSDRPQVIIADFGKSDIMNDDSWTLAQCQDDYSYLLRMLLYPNGPERPWAPTSASDLHDAISKLYMEFYTDSSETFAPPTTFDRVSHENYILEKCETLLSGFL